MGRVDQASTKGLGLALGRSVASGESGSAEGGLPTGHVLRCRWLLFCSILAGDVRELLTQGRAISWKIFTA